MIEYESVGKTVEDAVNSALAALKLNREDVDIKILDPGGYFRNAKVVILVTEEKNTNSELQSDDQPEWDHRRRHRVCDGCWLCICR